VELNMKIMTI